MSRSTRRIGRGFFNVVEKKRELEEARRAEELREQQRIQDEKITFFKDTLNLAELIAFRDRWLKLGVRKDMNKHISDLIGDDAALVKMKFGTDENIVQRAFRSTEFDVTKEAKIDKIKQIQLNYDDVTYNRFKNCIKDELIKLHDAKNKIVDLINDEYQLGIADYFKNKVEDINLKLNELTTEIAELKKSIKVEEPKQMISLKSTIGVFEPIQQQFPSTIISNRPTSDDSGTLFDFMKNEKIKQFINMGGKYKFQHASNKLHLCVIRNYSLIDRLCSIYPNLFVHFHDVIKLKFNKNAEHNYMKKFDNNYWFIRTMTNWQHNLELTEPVDKYKCGTYDRMFLDAIRETPIYDKIILVPSVRYCLEADTYLYIKQPGGYKIPDNKDEIFYLLKRKGVKMNYKPLIELDIINYFQCNDMVCTTFNDVWYEYEDQKTFVGNFDYGYDTD